MTTKKNSLKAYTARPTADELRADLQMTLARLAEWPSTSPEWQSVFAACSRVARFARTERDALKKLGL